MNGGARCYNFWLTFARSPWGGPLAGLSSRSGAAVSSVPQTAAEFANLSLVASRSYPVKKLSGNQPPVFEAACFA